ncbi:antibiotic biosynthesis monooxygenase family protein [Streptomyces sp. NPDC053560]|uniref:antibiotic biosynthesis monooxygenase family protein n=1 Tax=Streptomyces sp. NPDC053560 TaxID=3365711 RepID=UPI0037CF6A96
MARTVSSLPDIARPDAGLALVSTLYVGSPAQQLVAGEQATATWRERPAPEGFLSFNTFVSTDGQNILTYAQWTSEDAYDAFVRAERSGRDGAGDARHADPIRYRLHRSNVTAPGNVPGCIVAPVFDVDGPERQRMVADILLDGPLAAPYPGLVALHFHVSADGSRVLNYAEWEDEESHEKFMRSEMPTKAFEAIQDMPGVRGLGGKRYVLHESVAGTR